ATRTPVGEPLTGHHGAVLAVAVTSDDAQVITGGSDATVRVWDLATRTPVGEPLTGHHGAVLAVAVTSDDAQVITGGYDGTVRVWDLATRTPVGEPLTGHDGAVLAVAVTSDDAQVITGGYDATVRVWDRATRTPAGAPVGDALTGHHGPVWAVAVTPDGTQIITAGDDGTVRVWLWVWGQATRTPVGPQVRSLTVPQVGEPLTGHHGPVRAVAVAPDGDAQIITGGSDGTVRVWDLATRTPVGEPLTGHHGPVLAVAVTPDGTQIITAGDDGTVRVWSVPGARAPVAEMVTDAEAEQDRLGITRDVATLAALLAGVATRPPLSVAVMGDWGSGKSTFIHHLARHVEGLAGSDPVAYVGQIRQVQFNAWHYSDDQLWVGLIEQLFDQLRPATPAPAGPDEAALEDLETRLASAQAEQARHEEVLAEIDRLDPERGWWGWLGQIHRSWLVARAAGTDAGRELRAQGAWASLAWVAVAVAAVALSLLAEPHLTGVWAQLVTTVGWVGPLAAAAGLVYTRLRTVWRVATEHTDTARKRLLERRHQRQAEIETLEARLERLDPSRRLDRLLGELADGERYQSYRGLTGRIHRDLRALSDALTATENDRGGPWRIILYVDDLDRCSPARGAEVLQAVNLLLTMRLFLVVVAVDPRWLLRALTHHHGDLLTPTDTPTTITTAADLPEDSGDLVGAVRAGRGGVLDYLDKIFHLPYAMAPMQSRAADMLRDLLPTADPTATPRAPQPPGPGADRAATPPPASTAPSPQGPVTGRPSRGPTRQPSRPEPPTPAQRSAGPRFVGGALVRLQLDPREIEFLARLAEYLPTPRSVKKLSNIYRLLRIGVPLTDIEEFLGDEQGGPFQAAGLLLATIISVPGAAAPLIRQLPRATGENIGDALAEITNPAAHYLRDTLTQLAQAGPVHTATRTYQRWAPAVARYSFETYDLFVPPPRLRPPLA
ncbi:P-loop NTPase fold protein, partial [Pseudonocardia sp. NPDC049635]|uniref:P-loop NTPase fold protein n=1 Tax=Pseudonocardia sp. NPDC049635 TaxID=3155506 RepID=UPI0033DE2D3B